ncbi:protein of unknown function [Paraburkholderia kururiensis]
MSLSSEIGWCVGGRLAMTTAKNGRSIAFIRRGFGRVMNDRGGLLGRRPRCTIGAASNRLRQRRGGARRIDGFGHAGRHRDGRRGRIDRGRHGRSGRGDLCRGSAAEAGGARYLTDRVAGWLQRARRDIRLDRGRLGRLGFVASAQHQRDC